MKVILLKDVPKIGVRNEIKDVSDGYAGNYLLPRGLAEKATDKKIEKLKIKTKKIEDEREVALNLLHKNMKSLSKVTVSLSAKANDHGHLYEGIDIKEILEALKEQAHIELPEESIELPHPIKEVGEYIVEVKTEGEKGSFKVVIDSV